MTVFRFGVRVLALVLVFAGPVWAQATRTWVSGVGDDVNPCSRTAPCKTFAGAISKTAASGEIDVLDPGSYGTVTITKNITIDGGGELAGVLATVGTDGIILNGANIDVTLRNLDLQGATTGDSGINITNAKQLNVEHCRINQFTNGVTNTGAVTTKIQIVDSQIIDNVQNGILVGNGAQVTVSNSTVTGNGSAAIHAAGTAKVLVSNSNLSMNAVGVFANGSPSQIVLSHNDLFFNSSAPFQIAGGGVIYTYVDNRIQGTGIGGTPTPAPNPLP